MKYLLSLLFSSLLLLPNTEFESSSTQKFVKPLNGNIEMLSGFGIRTHPLLKQERMHNGIDLNTTIGDSVYAAGEGFIVTADFLGSYGNFIEIKHENGFTTRYAHLSKFHESITEGAKVHAGQPIAFAGNSGLVTRAMLHFEIHLNGSAKDPLNYIDLN